MQDSLFQADLLEQIVQGVDEGIAVVTAAGIIRFCNEQFSHLMGNLGPDVRGMLLHEIMPGLKMDLSQQEYRLVRTNKTLNVKFRRLNYVEPGCRVVIISNVDSGSSRETLLLKKAFETVLDNIDEGVIIADGDGRILYFNQVQLEFDNLNLEEILGKYTWDVYQFDRDMSMLLKVLETKKPVGDYIHYYITNRGQYVRVTGENYPVEMDGRVAGATAIYRNLQKSEEMIAKIVELQKKLHEKHVDQETTSGKKPLKRQYYSFDDILGTSTLMRECIRWAQNAALTCSPVFLYGETGTGKEMFAQSIHAASERAHLPFIAINCAAIPENLLEGILFGTVKGVFTGASDRRGLFEEAHGGTLFLDEINSMATNLQSKLLRVLEEKKVRRLGAKEEIPVDVRLISSSNIEPNQAVAESQLRSDLFFRLAVVTIKIPPLRERSGDIDLLVKHFIKSFNNKMDKNVQEISPSTLKMMEEYAWPGNVRQLKHWIECAINMIPEYETILNEKYAPKYFHSINVADTIEERESGWRSVERQSIFHEIREQECSMIKEALRCNMGNITKAAEELGMSRQSLQYRLRKYGIK